MLKNILNKFNVIYIFLLSIVYYFMLPVSMYRGTSMGDTLIFEYFGYAMTRGELMYSDLFDHKGPFIFIIHYLGYTIYGEVGIKILFAIFVFFFLYFSYKIIEIFTKGYEYIYIYIY